MRNLVTGIALAAGAIGLAEPSAAKVVKFEVVRVESPAFEGRVFGAVGTYDRIIARATVAVSPSDPHNAVIVDIDRAPRNAQGLVEAAADVEILRPTVPANGNRRLLYDVVNRGGKRVLAIFNDAAGRNDPVKAADAGSGFLMRRGYILVWSGWQGDLTGGGGRKVVALPSVPGMTGLSREEFIFDDMKNPASATLTYPAVDLDPAQARLTVRQHETDPRVTPSDLELKFETPSKVAIQRPAGFDAGAIYELIYLAKDPKAMGLGFAVTRDIVSFLRRESMDVAGNVLAGRIDYAIGFGQSQSGRFLRDLLYLGFNEDEAGRPVFDGLMPHIAGGKKMFTNYRFGQPGRNMQQHGDTLYPGAQFPFSYPVTTDAVTGRTDGLLARCLAAGNCPKIIQTDTELEFYQSLASLVVTDAKGEPLAMPDNVRLFLLSSLQHAAAANSKSDLTPTCTFPTNPLYAGPVLRALLVAMDGWIAAAVAPPASRYPSRADGTLVPPTAAAVGMPRIPGLDYKGVVHAPTVVDHEVMPPAKQAAYPVFVPKTDADGNDVAGVRLPTLAAPVATHLGWNRRKAGFSEGALCGNTGSMLPFAKTREERLKNDDPRPSLAERYPREGDRAAAIERAARQLVQDRLLLEDDVKTFVQATN
jgi:hypothetical protein